MQDERESVNEVTPTNEARPEPLASPPPVEELEQEWAALSCDCTGDFL